MSLAKRLRLECLKAGCKWGGTPSGAKMVPGRARSAYTTGQKSIGKQMDVVNFKVQRIYLGCYYWSETLWALRNGIICEKRISSTFSFFRLCHGVVGGNGPAFANTSSIHSKSSQRQKCQISIWIKCARVWYIYPLKSIISSCKPNITNCLETSKEIQIILKPNLIFVFGNGSQFNPIRINLLYIE